MQLNKFPDRDEFCRLAKEYNVIPVCSEILVDTETAVSLLQKFHGDENNARFLFESVEGGEKWGRYSFLGTSSGCDIRVYANRVEIMKKGGITSIRHDGDPLSVLRDLMAKYKAAVFPGLPRFNGGLVGYLTYEAVSFMENIPCHWPEGEPLAAFMIPDELIVIDNVKQTLVAEAIAFIDDGDEPAAFYRDAMIKLNDMIYKIRNFNAGYESPDAFSKGTPVPEPFYKPEVFREKVRKVKEYIHAGDIIQCVLSQPFSCKAPESLINLYRAQRFVNPSPYLFFFQFDETTMIGSSPETMVRLENNIATLRPIAGTRPRGETEREDRKLADELLADEKERAEHLMLVDLGRNDLGRVAETGTVQVTDLMFVERYSHVMHLVSNIKCDLADDMDAWDLIKAAFPAGTLSGAPKIRAMEIIAEMEETPRGVYGGAIGYIGFNGNMDLAITIRTASVRQGVLTIQAGAGIVADSDPEKERVESINKAKAIERALELMGGDSNETW